MDVLFEANAALPLLCKNYMDLEKGLPIVRNPERSVKTIHAALDAGKVGGRGMRNFVFTDGVMSLAR